jgi:hypothetical protein
MDLTNRDYLVHLNIEQYNIAINDDFLSSRMALCIIACAGAGKTTLLIAKIIYMIRELKCDPCEFFITTFTRNASNELKERLMEHLGKDIIDKMTLGTFHSIAYSKIMNNNNYIVEDNIESYLHKYSDLLDQDSDDESVDSMAIDEEIHEYKYVFIDEYQDINCVQEKIIKALYKTAKLLVVVGDDQQNIYTFRNTNIKYILNFTENYENSKYAYLIKNYRCNENFVQLANVILSYNENKIDKTIMAMKTDKPKKILMVSFKTQKNQLIFLSMKIKTLWETDKSNLQKTAIIARNNSVLKNLESLLASKNIPTFYIESNDDNIMTKQNIQDIKERVILSTIHGTKGLEFDNVLLIDVNSNVFPSNKCKDIEEERRLLYVAITRAKSKLYICYDERQPSIFINEIKNHKMYNDIVTFKSESDKGDILTVVPERTITMPEDYSIHNIISKMNYLDFAEFGNNIFDYHMEDPTIIKMHSEIPEYFGDFCDGRNLIITNISTIFSDFIETYILRTVQHIGNEFIENLDYVIYALFDFKKSIEDIRLRKLDSTIEGKFGINFKDKSDEDLERLILYYQSGVRISSYINDGFIPYFVNSYKQYISNKKSKDIIYDIFIISLVKGIIRGRNSILHLINFNRTKFEMNKINKSDLTNYKDWLSEIEVSYIDYFKDCHNINASYTLSDKNTSVKGIMDIQYADNIIRIKSSSNINPRVEILLQALSYVSIARRNNITINKCSIYNPLTGNIYIWNLEDWNGEDDTIFFLTDRFY